MLNEAKKVSLLLGSLTLFFSIFVVPAVHAEEIVISGNGAGAASQVSVSTSSQTTVQSNNTANVSNSVALTVNTGNNVVSNNNGTPAVQTGNAASAVNVTTDANSSTVSSPCCVAASVQAEISDNGTDSQNAITNTTNSQTTVAVTNTATVTNTILVNANTGGNTASNNNGDVTIKTGSINAVIAVNNDPINVSHIAVSQGKSAFIAMISNNGAFSLNAIATTDTTKNTIDIFNFANVLTNMSALLDTGDNHADHNNGDVAIVTGDIIATVAVDNKVNSSSAMLDCKTDQQNPPVNTTQSPAAPAPSNASSSSGGGSSSPTVAGIALTMLPETGSNILFLAIFGNIAMLLLGAFLRLHSGNSPGLAFA